MKMLFVPLGALSLIILSGCSSSGDKFRMTVANFGVGPIIDASVVGEDFRHVDIMLPVDIAGTQRFYPEDGVKLINKVDVIWKTYDGRHHSVALDLGMPGVDIVESLYNIPKRFQLWDIIIAYKDDCIVSGWVLLDDRFKDGGSYFGRPVLHGGSDDLLVLDNMITPDMLRDIPKAGFHGRSEE